MKPARFKARIIAALLAASGIAIIALSSAQDGESTYFDPALAPPQTCLPDAKARRRLLDTYRKVAAVTSETKPFGSRLDSGRPHDVDAQPPQLRDGLGGVHFAVSTDRPRAQAFFDQGLRLAYAFDHGAALRAFREAARLDPQCAMCAWGMALVLGPNINAPMEPDAHAAAFAAIRQAVAFQAHASEKERLLIAALARRYSNDDGAQRAALDQAYAAAMGEVQRRYPDDVEIAVLTAEALMDLSPWDYWDAGGNPKGRTAEILTLLDRALQLDPRHTGALHFRIHMTEASGDPERAVPHADRLGGLAPGAGHLVHMPSHIYYRVGRYLDSLRANKAAVAADERHLRENGADPLYRHAYYPHNIHFLMVSAQMAGDGPTAIDAAGKLDATLSDEVVRKVPWTQPIKAAPYFVHAQFSELETVLALPDPGTRFPYVTALWHYARGSAHAAQGHVFAAQNEIAAIERLSRRSDFDDLEKGGVPARDVLAIAVQVIRGRIAQAKNDQGAAIEAFTAAVALEDKLAYMEPPFWYYPVRQSLGAALAAAGETDRAETVFRESLQRSPNNGWALFGLATVFERRGDHKAAEAFHARLDRTWAGDRALLRLDRL